MRPEYEKIPQAINSSLLVKTVDVPNRLTLRKAWHYHPEIEICLTLTSEGKRFVGNVISEYEPGDLAMFGKNLPHGYLTNSRCHQIVVQFTPAFLGKEFMEKPEFIPLNILFNNARKGLSFSGEIRTQAAKKIRKLLKREGLAQIIVFLDLLNLLASTPHEQICTTEFLEDTKKEHFDRVKKVYDYVFTYYQREIKIREVAELICLTETSFCKFIKRHTKKTFSQILNETRIGFACKLLINTNMTISAISDECGFNSTSYFNRTFKRIMQVTPQNYRASYND